MKPTDQENPLRLDGLEFIEYASADPDALKNLFAKMGFQKVAHHKTKNVELFRQNSVNFILNREKDSFAQSFREAHGPSVCATGFRVKDAESALKQAVERGARPVDSNPHHSFPSIYGIGDSVVYFIDQYKKGSIYDEDFEFIDSKDQKGCGLQIIDHMTNNVPQGDMQKWCSFYEGIFNFKEKRFFDIQGKATGLVSKVMRSPCGKITIPINEPTDKKSQIQEYLDEYKGSGIQHIAFLTSDIVSTVRQLRSEGIEFLHSSRYIL